MQLLGISPSETSFEVRGFPSAPAVVRERLEHVGATFVLGYNTALADPEPAALTKHLAEVAEADLGFAYEGAGMALALLDVLTPWRRTRLRDFLAGEGSPHSYMVHIGGGWALARLRRPVDSWLARLDPLWGWLLLDGYGFHEGYFHSRRTVEKQALPSRLRGYARRAFDQGLGRSLWFVCAANPDRIALTIGDFPVARRPNLWAGLGLACAYAGGVPRHTIEQVRDRAHEDGAAAALAQGAAFAAKARDRAGNSTPHTSVACEVLTGVPADVAAKACDDALADLAPEGESPAFEVWRERIGRGLVR